MTQSLSLLLASSALVAALTHHVEASNSINVKVRVHRHKHKSFAASEPQTIAQVAASKKVFHVTGPKAALDEILTPTLKKQLRLDVWHVGHANEGHSGELRADIAATEDAIHQLQAKLVSGKNHHRKGSTGAHTVSVKAASYPELDMRISHDRVAVASCLYATKGYQLTLADQASYTESAYFDCFRPFEQIYEFFDMVAEEHPQFVTKIHNVSTTYENRSIHAYKLSLSSHKPKTAVYTQSLMHAREWQAGASTHFTFASLLDGLRNGDRTTRKLFESIDWYFVPIVNVDGYKYSWDVDRYWRTNRHPWNGFEGVDLNRNFPPAEFFNLDPSDLSGETNPGEAPLSEPESKGIFKFLMNIPELIGFVDVHAYGGLVMRPFSDIQGGAEEPYGSALKRLGDAVRSAMSPKKDGFQYVSQTSGELYPAYGCIDDGVFRATNYTVPTLTIEVEGDDFIAPQKTIRKVGGDMNHGLRRFATEAIKYRKFIKELKATK